MNGVIKHCIEKQQQLELKKMNKFKTRKNCKISLFYDRIPKFNNLVKITYLILNSTQKGV